MNNLRVYEVNFTFFAPTQFTYLRYYLKWWVPFWVSARKLSEMFFSKNLRNYQGSKRKICRTFHLSALFIHTSLDWKFEMRRRGGGAFITDLKSCCLHNDAKIDLVQNGTWILHQGQKIQYECTARKNAYFFMLLWSEGLLKWRVYLIYHREEELAKTALQTSPKFTPLDQPFWTIDSNILKKIL